MNTEISPQSSSAKISSSFSSFLRKNLISTIIVSTCLNIGLTGTATWSVWQTSQSLQDTFKRQDKKQELSSKLTYLDEVLTMSARMFTATGQSMWEKRYTETVPVYDQAFAKLTKDIQASQKFDAATKKLFEIEDVAFKLAKASKLPEASALLMGSEYQQNKQVYTAELAITVKQIKKRIEGEIAGNKTALANAIILALTSLGLLVTTGTLVTVAVRRYIEDQENDRQSIQAFQENLLQLNEQLQAEATLRSEQQTQIVQESEVLQTDVGHILDIVCSLEEGNLTVQAQVNERATGLVSDTLNRLIESLNAIIAVVVSSAHQVTDRATQLDQLAFETTQQAQNQTQSLQQVASLIAQVNQLTIDSRQQAIATTNAVQLAKTAVGNGQSEMSVMVGGIESLQHGTEQIVKRMQMLNDFVELAAQFSKDQKRVAALTRVLALNASLLSTRAINEQDPEQFASIAREFETISIQINELAKDTNRSLVMLQQRTNQIQTVTSGLDQDVSEISQLVQKFTDGVSKSRQAFYNIQAVTDQVAIMGEQVDTSSQDIVKAVKDTLGAVQSIGVISQNTENQSIVTREQVQTMAELAQNLLHKVEFFQLASAPELPEDSTVVPESVAMVFQPLASVL